MNTKRFLFFLVLTILSFQLKAQESFQRIYEANENVQLHAITQNLSGGYFAVNTLPDDTDSTIVNIMSLNTKGDINWSRNYYFNDNEEQGAISNPNIIILENDTFALILTQDKDSLNTIVTKIAPQGEVIWSKAYGLAEANLVLADSDLDDNIILDRPDGGMAIFSNIYDSTKVQFQPYIALLDSTGQIEFAQQIEVINGQSELLSDVAKTPDGGFILSGRNPQAPSNQSFLVKLDSAATIEWSKQYNLALDIQIADVEPTDSSTYIITGSSTSSSPTERGAIIGHVDSIGDPIWLNLALTDPSIPSAFSELIRLKDGSFQAAGFLESSSWVINFSADSIIQWQKSFPNAILPDDMHMTGDGGSVIGFDASSPSTPGSKVPHIVKTNVDGESSCAMDQDITFVGRLLLADTLIWAIITQDLSSDRFPQDSIYNGFNPPTLTLTPPPPFCEGDPIMVEFDATTEGATSYTWGGEAEGETTPIITATTAGMYTVDVRIDSLVCYNLCDTVIISEIGPPMAEIAQVGNVCIDGSSFLVANIDGFATDFLWSTGDDTPTTAITELGTYSVTVSNQCGANEAVTTLTDELSVTIAQLGDLCTNGTDTLAAVVNGTATSFTWNTGEGEETINITAEGDYAVVVNNLCSEASAAINVDCIFQVDACIGVPNAFTPDNDRDNDTFNVIIAPECQTGITVRRIEIWNRWGELVYESTNGQAWDGTQNGEDAASDVYLYQIEVEIVDEEDAIFKGDLTLIR